MSKVEWSFDFLEHGFVYLHKLTFVVRAIALYQFLHTNEAVQQLLQNCI